LSLSITASITAISSSIGPDRQTEVIACSVFEIDGQPLTVQPEILERPAIV
jgi:hypothetical protein